MNKNHNFILLFIPLIFGAILTILGLYGSEIILGLRREFFAMIGIYLVIVQITLIPFLSEDS